MTRPIYVDLQAAQNPSHAGRGIARYSVELTLAMLRAGLPVATVALSPHLPATELPAELRDTALVALRSARSIGCVAADGAFVYHLMSPMELELPPTRAIPSSALERADAVVAVLYDLIPLLFPDRYLLSPRSRESYLARLALVRDVDMILAISEHTRRDAIEHLGIPAERIRVIGGGASDFFRKADAEDEPLRVLAARYPAIRPPYVLAVAAWEWRKNLETLIDAMARVEPRLRRELQLVVVCSGLPPGDQTWQRAASDAGLRPDQFVVIGPVSDAVLRALYQATELFVFPSRYEGFGLPVIEAARCGAPVVTSSTSSLPEILELPASTFDPDDADELAATVERGVGDDSFRNELFDAGARAAARHTWDDVGERVRDAYASLERRRVGVRKLRRAPTRVAFVGRATDEGASLLASTPGVSVHVFATGGTADGSRHQRAFPVYPVEALVRHLDPYDYDVFVYDVTALGDRAGTVVPDLAEAHPGVTWSGEECLPQVVELVSALRRGSTDAPAPLS